MNQNTPKHINLLITILSLSLIAGVALALKIDNAEYIDFLPTTPPVCNEVTNPGSRGTMYYDSSDDTTYVCNGTIWLGTTVSGNITPATVTTTDGQIWLNDTGEEGNIYNTNFIYGYNDLRLHSSSSTINYSSIYLGDGLTNKMIGFYIDGAEKMKIDSSGNVIVNQNLTVTNNTTIGGTLTITDLTCTGGDCLTGDDINESTLVCASITGSADLCDGNDAVNDADFSITNEIQNVMANMGLQRDGSYNFGLIGTCFANQILKYNGTIWQCQPDDTGSGGLTGTGAANKVAFFTDPSTLSYNNNFHFDNTNTRLSIGSASPDSNFKITTVSGGIKADSDVTSQPAGYFSNPSGYALVTGSGNVGLGTNTPSYPLEIVRTGGTRAQMSIYSAGDVPNDLFFGSNAQKDRYSITSRGSSEGYDLKIYRNNGGWNPMMTFDWATGNVGIGTESPNNKLEVVGISDVTVGVYGDSSDNAYMNFGKTKGTTDFIMGEHYLGTLRLLAGSSIAGTSGIVINPSGNVGIGTDDPLSRLYITDSGGANIRIDPYATIGRAYSGHALVIGDNVMADEGNYNRMVNNVTHSSYAGSAIWLQGNDGITFHTKSGTATAGAVYSSPRMKIAADGRVGIGTTSPDQQLQVVGSVMIGETNTTGGNLYLYGTTAGKYSRMVTTNGNLHIDSGYGLGGGNGLYLNYYNGGTVYIGTGATGISGTEFQTDGDVVVGKDITFSSAKTRYESIPHVACDKVGGGATDLHTTYLSGTEVWPNPTFQLTCPIQLPHNSVLKSVKCIAGGGGAGSGDGNFSAYNCDWGYTLCSPSSNVNLNSTTYPNWTIDNDSDRYYIVVNGEYGTYFNGCYATYEISYPYP